jgi:hypothetical protein
MKVKVQFDDREYVYELPAEKVVEFLPITIEQLQKACKEVIKRI